MIRSSLQPLMLLFHLHQTSFLLFFIHILASGFCFFFFFFQKCNSFRIETPSSRCYRLDWSSSSARRRRRPCHERTIISSSRILSLQAARNDGNLFINQEVNNDDNNDDKGNNNDHKQQIRKEQQFDNFFFLTYSPTFHRYLVGRPSQRIDSYQGNNRPPPVLDFSSPNVQILRSFLWYDEAVNYLHQLRRQTRNDDGIDGTGTENHFSEVTTKPTWSYPMAAGTCDDGLLLFSTSPPTSQGYCLSNPTNPKQNNGCADPIEETLQVLASLTISHASFKAVTGTSSSSRTTIHNGRFSSSSSWSTETVQTSPPDDDTAHSSASPTPTSSNDPLSSHEDHHDTTDSKSSNRINNNSSNNDNKFLMDRMKEILKSHILDGRRWWVHPVRQDSHQREQQPLHIQMISSKRLIHHYQRVMDMLTRGRRQSASVNDHPPLLYPPGLAMEQSTARQVLAKFPVVLLYDHVEWIQERINLFLAPLPPPGFRSSPENQIAPESSINNGGGPRQRRRRRSSSHDDQDPQNMDWAMAYYQNGYGLGCTVEQATAAVVVLPQLLALNSLDASFGMVSVLYFYQQVPFHIMEQVRLELQDDLVGASPCNVAMMAWLHHVAHWSIPSCRALLHACSMIVLQCDIEPSWDVYENPKALVRRQLLGHVFEYLRHSLQLTPRHIKAMIKTHSRISTYSLTKVQSILAFLKQQYGFQSADLQTIILRLPSVLGMSIESAERHMNFFYHDGKCYEEEHVSAYQ